MSADQTAEAAWRAAVARGLKGGGDAALPSAQSDDGFPIPPLSPPDSQPALARGRPDPCAVLQRVDHPDPAEANRLARLDVQDEAAGLILTFTGAAGARGFGLPATADTVRAVLSGVDLGRIALRLELPPFAGPELPLALAADPAFAAACPRLDVGFDPLGDMARLGAAPALWPRLADALGTAVSRLRAAGLEGALLRADGRPVHEAGGTPAQELATVLSSALASLRAVEAAGLPLEEARRLLGFTLAAEADLLFTLAKCRALRVLWGSIEAACGLAPEPLRLHTETAWRGLARRDPHTNIVRGTLGCAAALLGGADSVTVLPFTSALGLPDAAARRLARNTPLILLEEALLGRIVDPGAGSGTVASLTEALRAEAWTLFGGLEAAGGLPAALVAGTWQTRIERARLARQQAVQEGRRPVVGTTLFAIPDSVAPMVLRAAVEPAGRPWIAEAAVRCPALPSVRDAQAAEGAP